MLQFVITAHIVQKYYHIASYQTNNKIRQIYNYKKTEEKKIECIYGNLPYKVLIYVDEK